MALNYFIVFVLGLLAGWLVEWIIDWVYWRRSRISPATTKYKPQTRISTSKTLSKKHLDNRVKDLAPVYPALADVITSMLSRPDIISESPDDVAINMQADLAGWFDDVMDRSSGDYKRKASRWAWLLGTMLAFVLNVDSIQIATRLWREPTVRQVIVAQAENYQGPEVGATLDEFVDQVNQLGIPIGWTTVQPLDGQQCGWMPGEAVYPAIWSNDTCQVLLNLPRMDDGWGWLLKFFGLLISGIAAAQGAPFWYDILKKTINFRSTGRIPKSTRNETPRAE
jgi:hypothetical protein